MRTPAQSLLFARSPAAAPVWREVRETVALGAPLILAQIGQIAINTTDVVMVGRLGEQALAAIALGNSLYVVFLLFGLGVVTAVAALAAQAHGARQPRLVRRTVRQGLWVATAIAVPSMLLLANAQWIFGLLKQDPIIAGEATLYVLAAMGGLLPALWLIALRSFVAALGRPKPVMWVMIAGVLCNAGLDYVLIFGHFGAPALGVVGAGLASTGVNTFMFLGLLGFALWARPFRRYAVLGRLWRADWVRFREILRIGLPIGATILMEVGMFVGATFGVGLISVTQLAAHHIALQCAAVTFMVPLGLSNAATVRVGQAYGRGDPMGVARAAWVALALCVLFMSLMALLFWLAPRQIIGLFVSLADPANADLIRYAVSFLLIAALFQVFDGAQVIGLGTLRGISDTKVPMLLGAMSYWGVGFAAVILLGFVLGLEGLGVWVGMLFGLVAAAVLLNLRFHQQHAALRPATVQAVARA